MSKIKAPKGAPFARILGVGGYRPVRVVPNEVILETIDSSDEWIRSRSGIETRHWASDEETVAAMSIEASGKAIADAGINADQIGAVVVSTVSHFSQTPPSPPRSPTSSARTRPRPSTSRPAARASATA